MRISFSAPGRCGIVGNPSDIYGGTVVSCSIPARAYCTLTLGEEQLLPEDATLWKAATARFPINQKVKVEWHSDIPRSSGLAGSTALLAATLACLLTALGKEEMVRNQIPFAELVRDVEKNEAGVMCGYQDAYMAVLGHLWQLDFQGRSPSEKRPPDLPFEFVNNFRGQNLSMADLPFLLITTGVERLSGSVHAPMAERWLKGEKAVIHGMARIAELSRLGGQALREGQWRDLAECMNENHEIVAALGGSGEPIDQLITACKEHGAMAAKLAGAGLGGTVIALTDKPSALQEKLEAKGYTRFLRPALAAGLTQE